MPEDAGKKRFIKDFLQRVQSGEGFVEDIWIERLVKLPGAEGKGSIAKSLSGRSISNITELLEDDLRHTFDEGFFTFRFVAALVGSGKTSLITYLHELTKARSTYRNLSVVVRFKLSETRMVSGSQNFSIKLYGHILAHTFWELLHNSDISVLAKNEANSILLQLLPTEAPYLQSPINFKLQFYPKLNKYLAESGVSFEDIFFYLVEKISLVEPMFSFVYLIDELDALQHFPDDINETRLLFKSFIRKAADEYKSKIRLMVYLVGTSENINGFISGDSPLENLVARSIIELNKGYVNEFESIKLKIEERIEGAYKGYKDFKQVWQEIKSIKFNAADNLKKFCQGYVAAVLQIHQKYFEEAPEQAFEGDARQLVEAQCKQQWVTYLKQSAYKISPVSTTTVIEGHAFDCYIELLHNGVRVARAFGEAKNYELLSGHLKTFKQWLEDVSFNPSTLDGKPVDLAFMIAPSCPPLLQNKLKLQKIQFIESEKKISKEPIENLEPNRVASSIALNQSAASISASISAITSVLDSVSDSEVEVVLITESGRAYSVKYLKSLERSSSNLLKDLLSNLDQSEEVVASFKLSEVNKTPFVVLCTHKGRIKRLSASELINKPGRSRIITKLKDDDKLGWVELTRTGEQLILATTNGRILRINVDDETLPLMGRIAQGRVATRLSRRDLLIGCVTSSVDGNLLLVTQNGYVKRLPVSILRRDGVGNIGSPAIQFKTASDNLVGVVSESLTPKLLLYTSEKRSLLLKIHSVTVSSGKEGTGVRIKLNEEEKILSVKYSPSGVDKTSDQPL